MDENFLSNARPKSSAKQSAAITLMLRADRKICPHRNLIAAIIGRCLADITLKRESTKREEIREARRWLFSEDVDPWSFSWCCVVLNLDPKVIQHMVKKGQIININGDDRRRA